MAKGIEVKAFLGYLKAGEVKIQLNQSTKWNRDKGINADLLTETTLQEKPYIGLWIPLPISYPELKNHEKKVKEQMLNYCPKLNLEKQTLCLFSQVFVS